MNEMLLHTPEGVRDIYGTECDDKVKLQRRLSRVCAIFGYQRIQTPTFEFFNIFNGERGTVASREMYKFFDREGNTLVLRPDITPSIARAVAKYYSDEPVPLRFCYLGNVYINNSSYQGLMKETTQLDAEFIGDDSASADAEVIAMAVEMLRQAGLKKFVLDIGHAGFIRALMSEAGLDLQSEKNLRELILNKNFFGIEALIEEKRISPDLRNILMELPRLSGSKEILQRIRELTKNEEALKIVSRLETIYGILKSYGAEEHVTFDLGMLTNYEYYTGVIFRGYTYGTGDAIVKGGRYDRMVGQFGKDAPSVGFALIVDQLMIAMRRQKIEISSPDPSALVLYEQRFLDKAVHTAQEMRRKGICVTMQRMDARLSRRDYQEFCRRNRILKIIEITQDACAEVEVG